MPNILKRNGLTLLLALPLISCGNADVALPNDAQAAGEQSGDNTALHAPEPAAAAGGSASGGSGDIVLLIAGAQDGKGAAGVTSCEIDFQVRNGLSEPIKFVAAFWRPVVVDGIVTAQSAVDARGDQRFYGGKVAAGETKSRKGKVTGVSCEHVTGLRLWDVTCGLESRADCKDRVSVDNQSQLTLSP
ncbi:hypothetical protein [Arenimonas donghaensis]|uniref:Lipoprotein n=1 Tax=Arenimonas donghaensis DSM 18148 = HO3-R19 TaxID=1121014 RepID=A0A087MK46_9GAMM|nr:hypothetical protein [Arenimonas donghaensis]KFL37249.1 hypothetical protein N788_10440 [Arenimonas donghaensis DSM 18148 = HO3-R19]